jgi:DNA-binding transcriptional ArsR family regulator
VDPRLEKIRNKFAAGEEVCKNVLRLFSMLSNKTRFRIICMLSEGDFCVNEIVDTVQMGKISNISQQLRILTLAGILEKRRDAQKVIYTLADVRYAALVRFLEQTFTRGEETA